MDGRIARPGQHAETRGLTADLQEAAPVVAAEDGLAVLHPVPIRACAPAGLLDGWPRLAQPHHLISLVLRKVLPAANHPVSSAHTDVNQPSFGASSWSFCHRGFVGDAPRSKAGMPRTTAMSRIRSISLPDQLAYSREQALEEERFADPDFRAPD